MNVTELAALAIATLNAQQRYFKDRQPENLSRSMDLERRLRRESEAILKLQGSLFEETKSWDG